MANDPDEDGVNPPDTGLLDRQIDRALDKRGIARSAETGGSGGGSGGLEARLAKVEASVEHIQADTKRVHDELSTLRMNARTDFRTLFAALIAATLGLAGLMAKGFHWI